MSNIPQQPGDIRFFNWYIIITNLPITIISHINQPLQKQTIIMSTHMYLYGNHTNIMHYQFMAQVLDILSLA